MIVDAITTARPDTKTAAYVCLLSRISPLASIASPLYRRNMTCITAPPVDDCKAYRFLRSVKGQQQQKLPSAVHSIVNLSIKIVRVAHQAGRHNITVTGVRRNEYTVAQFRLVLFCSCGALLNKRQVEDIDKSFRNNKWNIRADEAIRVAFHGLNNI